MDGENERIAHHIASRSDEELRCMLNSALGEYTDDALAIARAEAEKRGVIPIPERKVEGEKDKQNLDSLGNNHSNELPKSVKIWAGVGFVWSVIYLVVGIINIPKHDCLSTAIGWSCIIDFFLFFGGSFLACIRQFSGARVCWIIGGIDGLPLGAVMLFGARHLKKVRDKLNQGSKTIYVEVGAIERPERITILENALNSKQIDFYFGSDPSRGHLVGGTVRLMVASSQAAEARDLVEELEETPVELSPDTATGSSHEASLAEEPAGHSADLLNKSLAVSPDEVVLRTFVDRDTADVAAARLGDKGIMSFVSQAGDTGGEWQLAVGPDDAAEAEQEIRKFEKGS